MKKIAKVLTALIAVGFVAGLGATPVSTANASHHVTVHHVSDTGWG